MSGEENALEWAARLKPTDNSGPQRPNVTNADQVINQLPIGHQELPMTAGHSEVLVLEDQPLDQSDSDVLVSLERRDQELAEKRIAAMQRKRPYTPFQDDELMVAPMIRPTKILPKYDEDDNKMGQKVLTQQLKTDPVDKGSQEASTLHRFRMDAEQPSIAARRNVRRKMASFTDDPMPLVSEPIPPVVSPTTELVLDDDELQRSLAKARKKIVSISLPRIEELPSSVDANPSVRNEGIILSDATNIASSITSPFVIKPEDTQSIVATDIDLVAGTNKTNVLKPSSGDLSAFEKEPLVRRGVAATLQFMTKLGIRPQLCSEKEPPRQRKPDGRLNEVKIEHYDEDGNLLTPKEAYKLLSHRFHGKAPGKSKQEKNMRKRAEKQRMQASSLIDTPLGTATAMRERQKATGTTHIVLARGRRAASSDLNAMSANDVQRSLKDIPKRGVPRPATSVKKMPRIFVRRLLHQGEAVALLTNNTVDTMKPDSSSHDNPITNAKQLADLMAIYFPQYGEVKYECISVATDEPHPPHQNQPKDIPKFRCAVHIFGLVVGMAEVQSDWDVAKEAAAGMAVTILEEFLQLMRRPNDTILVESFGQLANGMEQSRSPSSIVASVEEKRIETGHQKIISMPENEGIEVSKETLPSTLLSSTLYDSNAPTTKRPSGEADGQTIAPYCQISRATEVNPISVLYQHWQKHVLLASRPTIKVFAELEYFGAVGEYCDYTVVVKALYSRKSSARYEAARLLCQKVLGNVAEFRELPPDRLNVGGLKAKNMDVATTKTRLSSDPTFDSLTELVVLPDNPLELSRNLHDSFCKEIPNGPLEEKGLAGRSFISILYEFTQKTHRSPPNFVFVTINQSPGTFCCRIADFDGQPFMSYVFTRKKDAKGDCAGRIVLYILEKGMIDKNGQATKR